MKLLLDANASIVNIMSSIDGTTPIMFACEQNNTLLLSLLLQYKPDLKAIDNKGCTALYRATQSSASAEIIQLLLKSGLDMSLVNNAGQKSLDIARSNSNYNQVIEMLDIDSKLFEAAARGNIESTTSIISKRAFGTPFVLMRDSEYRTVFHIAAVNHQLRYLRWLKNDHAADVNIVARGQRTALHMVALKGSEVKSIETARLLLELGCAVDCVDYGGKTPLNLACANGYDQFAAFLLSKGANLRQKDHDGRSPLSIVRSKSESNPLHGIVLNYLRDQQKKSLEEKTASLVQGWKSARAIFKQNRSVAFVDESAVSQALSNGIEQLRAGTFDVASNTLFETAMANGSPHAALYRALSYLLDSNAFSIEDVSVELDSYEQSLVNTSADVPLHSLFYLAHARLLSLVGNSDLSFALLNVFTNSVPNSKDVSRSWLNDQEISLLDDGKKSSKKKLFN